MSDDVLSSAERALSPAELYERVPCGLLVTDAVGRVLRANTTFAGWLGRTPEELSGTALADLLEPGSRIFYETRLLPSLGLRGDVREVALSLIAPDGDDLFVMVNATLDPQSEGEPVALYALFPGSERRDYERQLLIARRSAEESEARTRVLQDATAAFADSRTDASLAQALADIVRSALNATVVAVHLAGSEPAVAGGPIPVAITTLPGGTADLLDEQDIRTWSVRDDADSTVSRGLRAARLETAVSVPLIRDGTAAGAIACYFAREPEIDEHRLDMVRALGRQAVQTLGRIRLQGELAAIALQDPLTGLANRFLLGSRLAAAVVEAEEREQPLALLFVDLDDFKTINDELGHAAGDELLRQVARRLVAAVRAEDLVCRYGGDEFIVVCRNTDEQHAAEIAERIRLAIREPIVGDGWERSISGSIGVTVGAGAAILGGSELLHEADGAMYRSKSRGKDRVTLIEH
ncbi:sensor domain-containing protein [Leifsonia sp. AG29]|uniref:sensor domain-containing protein n=1 Tax=Leifsonia sp. AG29 TaxID=2598860 RepID=UPI001E578B99|nr:diguanylate cyclase [Leifsonia sp. AG29]